VEAGMRDMGTDKPENHQTPVIHAVPAGLERALGDRVASLIKKWQIGVDRVDQTDTSILVYGRRKRERVVLKVTRAPGDEWRAGRILRAFDGRGVVRALDYTDGAMLLEHLNPGHSLVNTVATGDDNRATEILAHVIARMGARLIPTDVLDVNRLAVGFERYQQSGDRTIPESLLESAHGVFTTLARSQSQPRLLHGDLHHYNVLLDERRDWVAIDPKGLVGEIEYEIGAILRNPMEHPTIVVRPSTIERRVAQLSHILGLDPVRTLGWGFAQAVLSVIWMVEDGCEAQSSHATLVLAETLRSMLKDTT